MAQTYEQIAPVTRDKIKSRFGKRSPRKFTDEEQGLRELWNAQEIGDPVMTEGGPVFAPKAPPMFRGEPTIVGKELGREAEKLFSIAPNLRGKSPRVQFGPGSTAIGRLQGVGRDPLEFGRLNLLGVTRNKDKEINMNPSLGSPEWLRHISMTGEYGDHPVDEILAHEMTHAAGYDEPEADIAEKLMRKRKSSFGRSKK